MASVYPTKSGYRAQVYVGGRRETKQFRTKREAGAWGHARELELRTTATLPVGQQHTLLDAFDRYERDVAPAHKGWRWEVVRLKLLARQLPADKKIGLITTQDIAAWRDERLKSVSASSVLREIKLLASVFEVARREWQWIGLNPVRDVRKPRQPEHRQRVIHWREIRAVVTAMGHGRRKRTLAVSQAVAILFLVALRTGMRASELCSLTWDNAFEKHCRLPDTKSGRARDVPLSRKTKRLIERMRGWDDQLVFAIKPATLDSIFRRYRERAGLAGFTFHDARHTAATWMARKVDVLDLCKIFGWTSPKMAMTYYNPTPQDLADRL